MWDWIGSAAGSVGSWFGNLFSGGGGEAVGGAVGGSVDVGSAFLENSSWLNPGYTGSISDATSIGSNVAGSGTGAGTGFWEKVMGEAMGDDGWLNTVGKGLSTAGKVASAYEGQRGAPWQQLYNRGPGPIQMILNPGIEAQLAQNLMLVRPAVSSRFSEF